LNFNEFDYWRGLRAHIYLSHVAVLHRFSA
jgi:hypothetical protein